MRASDSAAVVLCVHGMCKVQQRSSSDHAACLSACLQGPIKRLAATVEQAVSDQSMYLQQAQDSELAGEWNTKVGGSPTWGSHEKLHFTS